MSIREPSRFLTGVAVVALWLVALGAPAGAHDPIFVTPEQTTPETGPYLPDGTISFAIYGTLFAPEETRGLEFDLREGDDLYVQLLIPDLEPETTLAPGELPYAVLTTPSGEVREIRPDVYEPFADPFSQTNYVILHEALEPGVEGGRYQVVVTGSTPTRFVVAVGQTEEFFTPTERTGDKPENFLEIAEPLGVWYSTPATGEATAAPAESAVDVDVDLIEEELEKLAEDEAAAESDDDDSAENAAAPPTTAAEPQPEAADEGQEVSEDVQATTSTADENGSGGGGLGWVAPVVIVVAVAAGAGFYLRRRTG